LFFIFLKKKTLFELLKIGFDDVVEYLRSCYDDEGEVQEYETPSPLGKIRNVTKGF